MVAAPFGLFERMLAGRYLRAKRQHGGVALISIISVLAILLAVFVLIVTMSVMNGFRETLLSRILGVNGHVFVDVRNLPRPEIDRLARLVRETIVSACKSERGMPRTTTPDAMPSAVASAFVDNRRDMQNIGRFAREAR